MSPALVVCGPQTDFPSAKYLSRINHAIHSNKRLQKFLHAIVDLPSTWQVITEAEPRLASVPGLECINAILHWLDHGIFPNLPNKALNVLLTPLTILFQIVEYITFLDGTIDGTTHGSILATTKSAGIQGFCTGYLTAAALSLSKDEDDINTFGAVALRLALCIGAFVDLAGPYACPTSETACLTVRWRDSSDEQQVKDIISSYRGAYISVISDLTSVTVTVAKSDCLHLTEALSSCGFIVKKIQLEGLFHNQQHANTAQRLLELFDTKRDFQFLDASKLLLPLRSNIDGEVIKTGRLEEIAVNALVLEISNWYSTISNAISTLRENDAPAVLLTLGPVGSISATIVKDAACEISIISGTKVLLDFQFDDGHRIPSIRSPSDYRYPEHAIAVVGMACRFPGADSVDEFWKLLNAGASMVGPVPTERFQAESVKRSGNKKDPLWGNFVHNIDAFDHRFFKKSSREAQSMDPQQRFLLEVAYDALASSGYFGVRDKLGKDDTGCFLGIGSTDYCDNVASHPPTAFSAVGTLRAFLSGKLSHYFGWTAPSITYDTACSSSAVAIHAACTALARGECSRALTGGVNLITSPALHQNLMAANFLSPTGATKSFDAMADGYCRGEGVGLVVLKRLSDALADGDNILGVIAGSAVNQNSNASPITVPHSASQIELYRKVANLANIDPLDVSYVEAHGTGTPVGDPIECESIRDAFAGQGRRSTMYLGSVKANIGHTEAASGAAGLIKTILMLQHSAIPVQPNFTTLNPKIRPLETSNMEIPRFTKSWDSPFRAACVNNYGAAGSNAALIVCQAPETPTRISKAALQRYPIFISAHSDASLAGYCGALKTMISHHPHSSDGNFLPSLAFNLATKQNRTLQKSLVITADSMAELDAQLSFESDSGKSLSQDQGNVKPVILAFSGQTRDYIGLSKEVYSNSALFRTHLDHCDEVLKSLGLPQLFPGIFSNESVEDIVSLHCMIFAFQYASAMSWIDSGLHVDMLVGHSFGQLTALCISGTLSLSDTIKLVSGRASLMVQHWGAEKGSMIHIEANEQAINQILDSVNYPVSVACYNATTSHVVVGSKSGINAVEVLLKDRGQEFGITRFKRLNTTHGFHSEFTEPLLHKISTLAEQLTFNEAKIPLESCTEDRSWSEIGPLQVSQHTRLPVFFSQAIGRISERFGPCTWVGIGPGSAITSMIGRALDSSNSQQNSLQIPQLEGPEAMLSLADITSNLWKMGCQVQFWPFHVSQTSYYSPLHLPTYQFEKSRHWLEYIDTSLDATPPVVTYSDGKARLISPIKSQNNLVAVAEFLVDQQSDEFYLLASGHSVLGQPLCPAALYLELTMRAAVMTEQGQTVSTYDASVEGLEIKAPLGLDKDKFIKLSLTLESHKSYSWKFQLSSQNRSNKSGKWTVHAVGRVILSAPGLAGQTTDFAIFKRLINHSQYSSLFADANTESIQGQVIYKIFDQIVRYAEYYRGMKTISSKDNRVAGLVTLSNKSQSSLQSSLTHPIAVDNFLQVAGIHVNNLSARESNEVYVATQIKAIQLGQDFNVTTESAQSWNVYSTYTREGDKEVINDIFVFEPGSKKLVMIILGVRFTKVSTTSLTKALAIVNTSATPATFIPSTIKEISVVEPIFESQFEEKLSTATTSSLINLEKAVLQVLNEVADVPMDDESYEASFEDLGIDSLMVNEVLSAINNTFGVDLPLEDFQDLQDCRGLAAYIQSRQSIDVESASSKWSTPDTLQSSATSDLSDDGFIESNPTIEIPQLAQLIGDHLEVPQGDIKENTCLSDIGLDSLLTMELADDIEKKFGARIDANEISPDITFGDLCKLAFGHTKVPTKVEAVPVQKPAYQTAPQNLSRVALRETSTQRLPVNLAKTNDVSQPIEVLNAPQVFNEEIRHGYDEKAKVTKFTDFWTKVYPLQSKLVTAYVVEAFDMLGCSLRLLRPGQQLQTVPALSKHKSVMGQLFNVLEESHLIEPRNGGFVRTQTPVSLVPSQVIFEEVLQKFPQHASEHKLLQITGSKLGECLSGAADPIQLIFRDKATKDLLTDVYTNAPMFAAGTFLLGDFLSKVFESHKRGKTVQILELGGGTGGTTKYIVDHLVGLGIDFTYTFTDLSPSLVGAAKKKFAHHKFFKYMVLDIEKTPTENLCNQYDVILSTNCIHATRNLVTSLTNIRKMLNPTGFVSLVELTRNIPWFDLVFGLLEGWWLFNDGRKHALADVSIWDKDMKAAGFKTTAWSEGTPEAGTLRIVAGFQESAKPVNTASTSTKMAVETVTFKQENTNMLQADIYYPGDPEFGKDKRPVALMIHGGGHIMLSRKDVRRKQTQLLLDNGLLPVSIDYRLCPEINILDGPMTDVCDALRWVRNELPYLKLKCPGLRIDGERVVVVGWSTGGLLAMTLAWTAMQQNIKPPEAILAFYCPTDYEDTCWKLPNFPEGVDPTMLGDYDLLEAVQESTISSYTVPRSHKPVDGWISAVDPRSRIALHMNWTGQTLPVLLGGLPSKKQVEKDRTAAEQWKNISQPGNDQVIKISPYAQIQRGTYRTPTFLIHGKKDDLIPWQQSERVSRALACEGVASEVRILDDAIHLFDLYDTPDGKGWKAIVEGYEFLFSFIKE